MSGGDLRRNLRPVAWGIPQFPWGKHRQSSLGHVSLGHQLHGECSPGLIMPKIRQTSKQPMVYAASAGRRDSRNHRTSIGSSSTATSRPACSRAINRMKAMNRQRVGGSRCLLRRAPCRHPGADPVDALGGAAGGAPGAGPARAAPRSVARRTWHPAPSGDPTPRRGLTPPASACFVRWGAGPGPRRGAGTFGPRRPLPRQRRRPPHRRARQPSNRNGEGTLWRADGAG